MRPLLIWCKSHVWGLLVGMTIILASVNLYAAGNFERLSLLWLDLHFRHANPIGDHDDIVLIDIDDDTFDRLGWPWKRRRHADVVSTLHELGAEAVVMDLVFDQPTASRLDDPRLEPDYDVDQSGELLGEVSMNDAICDDCEFAEALSHAGNVYLALFGKMYHPKYVPSIIRAEVYSILEENPKIAFARFRERMSERLKLLLKYGTDGGRHERRVDLPALFDVLRIQHQLEMRFDLTMKELAEQLGLQANSRRITDYFATAKRTTARRVVSRYRRDHPDATWEQVYAHFCPGKPLDFFTPDREDLLRAFRFVSSQHAVLAGTIPIDDSLVGRVRNAADLTYPLDKLAEASKHGMVTFQTDADGVVRRVPLVLQSSGRLLKHLGFAVACQYLGIDERTIRVNANNELVMSDADGRREWRVPIDEYGRTLINWHAAPAGWQHSFKHIKIARVMEIPVKRRDIRRNEGRLANFIAPFVEARFKNKTAYLDYVERVRRRADLRWSNDPNHPPEELTRLEDELTSLEKESVDFILENARGIEKAVADGLVTKDELRPDEHHVVELAQRYEQDERSGKLAADIANIRHDLAKTIHELRPLMDGKICVIGYTAAAMADTANSPVFTEMPGVLAHANVINSMINGESGSAFPRLGPMSINIAIMLAAGAMVTIITTWRDPWISLISMLLMVAILAAVSFSLFYTRLFYLDVVGAVVCVFLTWVFVTLYRQFVEERQKRAFRKSLAQYTSPAIAAQLAARLSHRAGGIDLSPQPREVTCFFSDLKGFTSISERLGASRTRDVLNPYLEAMSDVLIRYNAMINKFMGDGIFAFFNPPIYPVEAHAQAACEATIDSFMALEELKKRIAHGDIEAEAKALSMRVGVNSGEVFVGDYGSSSKLDYTCIGDTVNLAARLEPACKVFGVQSLISETTRSAVGDQYVVRHLGGLQVVGKQEAIPVYELIGRRHETNGDMADYAALFGEAVEAFQRRDWESALKILEQCRKQRPRDIAIDLLILNIRTHQTTPPSDDWNKAIQLTSK